MATVYDINKGINRSLEFKGIKAQYIMYLAAGMVVLLLLFAILFAIGINVYINLGLILLVGGGFVFSIQRMSRKYGEHGLVKIIAARKTPSTIPSRSRKVFISLKTVPNVKQ